MNWRRAYAWLRPRASQSTSPEGQQPDARGLPVAQDDDILAQERDRNLQGYRRYQSFRTMRRKVHVVAAYWMLIEALAAKARFTIDGQDDDPRVRATVFDGLRTNWAQTKSDMAEAVLVGFSLSEWITERTSGGYRLVAIRRIPQATIREFRRDSLGLVDYFGQYTDRRRFIRRWQTLYVVVGSGNEGHGALLNCADLSLQYLNHQRQIMSARNANAKDLPDFYMPRADIQQKSSLWGLLSSALDDRLSNMRAILPSEPHEGDDAAGGIRFAAAAKQYEAARPRPVPAADNDRLRQMGKEIAVALNAEALLLGQDGAGSLALARVQAKMLMDTAMAGLERCAEEVGRMIGLLWMFNGWRDVPKVTIDNSEWLEPTDMADALASLATVDRAQYAAAVDDILLRMGLPPSGGD